MESFDVFYVRRKWALETEIKTERERKMDRAVFFFSPPIVL